MLFCFVLLCFQDAKTKLEGVKDGMKEINDLSTKVAVHFCENESSFKLEEFLSIMKTFCEKVHQCQKVKHRELIVIHVAPFYIYIYELVLKSGQDSCLYIAYQSTTDRVFLFFFYVTQTLRVQRFYGFIL